RDAGVGSNLVHPLPPRYNCGHVCASWLEITPPVLPLESVEEVPGKKPTAIRAGIPAVRAMMVIAVANCTQYPWPCSRKSHTASSERTEGTVVVYSKRSSPRKKS